MSATTLAEVEARLESLVATFKGKEQLLKNARHDLRLSEQRWLSRSEDAVALAAGDAARALNRDRKAIAANVAELRSSALNLVTAALEQHAPGYLSADWTDRIWSEQVTPQAGEWMRIGTAALGSHNLPVVLPLSAGVWSVICPDADTFRGFVQNCVARAVSAFDPARIQVLTYDPNLRLDVGVFAAVRAVSQTSVPPAITSEDDFERALDKLRTDIAAVDDRLTASGQSTYWAALAAGHSLATTTPFRLLIVGAQSQIGDRCVARLDQIRKLAADRGLLVVESVEPTLAPSTSTTIELTSSKAATSRMPGVNWTPDTWAGDSFIRTLGADLANRPRQSLAPTVNFEQIVDAIVDPWLSEADDGLEAVIGIVDAGDLVLRLRAENPPMPNALIGGAVGQGKSNLLLVLIHSLAAKYSPAELEMVLVDLRDGVEFARLGPSSSSPTWLPHIRALGLEFDADYTTSVLRWVRQKMVDRSELLKANEATTLKQYREKTGKTLPRLLVVIDEFQRLFEGDDDQVATAARDLDDIARTGRGFGVHIVLASQAITGIRGLATKSESIFGQFHNRIVLKNTPAESQAFLTTHNLAAASLEHRGQAVFNNSLGAIDKNKLGTVAYADPNYLQRLQIRLYQQGHGAAPSIFQATAFAQWPRHADSPTAPDGIVCSVGLPIEVEAQPRSVVLTRSPNQALAVVGSTKEIAISVLVRAVVTAAQSIGPTARLALLDGMSNGHQPVGWVHRLASYLAKRGYTVDRVSRDDVATKVVQLAAQGGTTDLVVPIALDAVDLGTPMEPDYQLPSESLRELVRSGPMSGTWTIGWWQSKSVLEEHLGFRATGVRGWAFAGVSRDDLTDIAGHTAREPATSPRFVWFDRTDASGTERLVPFAANDVLGMVDVD